MSYVNPVLVVEDDENDIAILRSAFADLRAPSPVRVVRDGQQAIHYLVGVGEFQDRVAYPPPGLMLLDLQLPGMSGFAVLRWLCRNPEYKANLRVVVVTSFAWPDTAQVVKRLGGDEFFEKPIGYALLKECLRGVLARAEGSSGSGVLTPVPET